MANKQNQPCCEKFKTMIGGQALIEGIMMRGPEKDAIVIRGREGLTVEVSNRKLPKKGSFKTWPFFRGIFSFFDAQVTGVKALMRSADLAPEEYQEEPSKFDLWLEEKMGNEKFQQAIIGIAVALVVGAAVGAVIGAMVTKGRIPPFIVTLGVMQVVRSVAQYFTKSYTPTVPKTFELISNYQMFGQRPMTIIYWVILAIIFYLIMKHTAFGRHVYAVGSNERTTRLSGINTNKVKMMVYMISGLMVAVASVIQLSRLGGMDVASAGNGYEMDSIAAVVVGGTAMSGGKGSILGTVLGVLIIGIMKNLLILLGVDSFLSDAFQGAIVVIAVLMQRKEKIS